MVGAVGQCDNFSFAPAVKASQAITLLIGDPKPIQNQTMRSQNKSETKNSNSNKEIIEIITFRCSYKGITEKDLRIQ